MSESILSQILDLAADGDSDALLETTISSTHEALYDRAVDGYGSWEAALIEALVSVAEKPTRSSRSTDIEENVVRTISENAKDPVYIIDDNGLIYFVDAVEFDITESPWEMELPDTAGLPRWFGWLGSGDGIFVFTNHGRYFGLDARMIPQWMGPSELRDFRPVLGLQPGEYIRSAIGRNALYSGRFVHVTVQGKGKASAASDYGRSLDRTGKDAFVLADGDEPVAVFTCAERTGIFCASAQGQGIHFDASDIRTMGRKSMGVNVMKLGNEEDRVVNAFEATDVDQLAVVSAEGYAKRVFFDDFRQQGRGGQGMQLARVDKDDDMVGCVPVQPDQDLAIITTKMRVHRFPATTFALMGRPAKGQRVIDLVGDERVRALAVLPCSTT